MFAVADYYLMNTRKKLYAKPREHSAGGVYSLLTGRGFAFDEKSIYLFNLGKFEFEYFISSYMMRNDRL